MRVSARDTSSNESNWLFARKELPGVAAPRSASYVIALLSYGPHWTRFTTVLRKPGELLS